MNDKVPKELQERQEMQRQETIKKVQKAIDDLNAEAHKVSIKLLMEHTGLSRSVFGKKHIRDVLIDNGVVESKSVKVKIQKPVKLTEQGLWEKIASQEEVIKQLRKEKEELHKECEMLRAKIFVLMNNM